MCSFLHRDNGLKTKEEVMAVGTNLGGFYCLGIAAISREKSRLAPVVNALFTFTKAFVDGRL